MDFLELARKRCSVRGYTPVEVEEHKLLAVLEAVRLAPTACNQQPFRFVVMHTRGREAELAQVYPKPWFVEAPLVVAAVGLPKQGWSRRDGVNYNLVDVAIAMDHLTLAAADLGLGTCWVADFDPARARDVLALPADCEPVAFTPLGYARDVGRAKRRKPASELVAWERW